MRKLWQFLKRLTTKSNVPRPEAQYGTGQIRAPPASVCPTGQAPKSNLGVPNAPGWDPDKATRSEAVIKAERSPPKSIAKLQDETVKEQHG